MKVVKKESSIQFAGETVEEERLSPGNKREKHTHDEKYNIGGLSDEDESIKSEIDLSAD